MLLSMIMAKISGIDSNEIMKQQLNNVKQQLEAMKEADEESY